MFLITGHASSGTKYMSHVLRSLGIDAGHEKKGADGVVSWMHLMDSGFDPVLLQVRNPLHCISSSQTLADSSMELMLANAHIPNIGNRLLKNMYAWLAWNRLAEAQNKIVYRYTIENLPEELPEILKIISHERLQAEIDIALKTPIVNQREHTMYSWDDLYNEDAELAASIQKYYDGIIAR